MVAVLIFFGALWIAGVAVLLLSARNAPRGFEDATGFHEIEMDENEPQPAAPVYAEARLHSH